MSAFIVIESGGTLTLHLLMAYATTATILGGSAWAIPVNFLRLTTG